MAFDFPNSPTPGQIVTGPGGIQWQWDNIKWTVINSASPGVAPINNPIFTGDPQAPTPPYGDNDQSLSNTSFVQSAVTPLSHNVGRNLLHNGMFNIQQRGAGPWTTNVYGPDRWATAFSNDTCTTSIVAFADSDRTAIGDEAAIYGLQIAFVGSATASSFSQIFQRAESLRRFSGKTVTISFWARATSGAPKIGIDYQQIFGSGGSPSASVAANIGVTPALSSTWQRYSVTGAIPSAAGKTFGTTSGTDQHQVSFWTSDQGTFAARSGGIGVQSGTVQFWGMQLEIGPTATPLEKLDPQVDLANCQRFFIAGLYFNLNAYGLQGAWCAYTDNFTVAMRAAPTITPIGTPTVTNGNAPQINPYNPLSYSVAVNAATTAAVVYQGAFQASADL